ncbi:hypothetical protein SLS56_009010 [Neofusicoccum ribis]|uniref:Syntaxin N-terminal domain-containing protein n=1 Tax=Neofusicoccum ribis TaxID=45134 RepID=A0ABR3SIG8_9PEZI
MDTLVSDTKKNLDEQLDTVAHLLEEIKNIKDRLPQLREDVAESEKAKERNHVRLNKLRLKIGVGLIRPTSIHFIGMTCYHIKTLGQFLNMFLDEKSKSCKAIKSGKEAVMPAERKLEEKNENLKRARRRVFYLRKKLQSIC